MKFYELSPKAKENALAHYTATTGARLTRENTTDFLRRLTFLARSQPIFPQARLSVLSDLDLWSLPFTEKSIHASEWPSPHAVSWPYSFTRVHGNSEETKLFNEFLRFAESEWEEMIHRMARYSSGPARDANVRDDITLFIERARGEWSRVCFQLKMKCLEENYHLTQPEYLEILLTESDDEFDHNGIPVESP